MSFRRRLTLFFVLLVALPMVVVAVLVSVVAGDSRTGQADARLAASTETALAVYEDRLEQARDAARAVGRDPALAGAVRDAQHASAQEAAARMRRELGLASVVVRTADGELASAGRIDAIATSALELRGPEGTIGKVVVGPQSAAAYVAEVERLTGSDVAVLRGDEELASTLEIGGASIDSSDGAQDLKLGDGDYRLDTVAPGGADKRLRLAVFAPVDSGGPAATPPLVAGALAAFFAVALFFIAMLLRALQSQVGEMFAAARRVGQGDFSQQIPVEGDDEMAGLARELNKMSAQLAEQMDELRHQRVELERSVQRIGEAFASGLDLRALLEIVAETALGACDASAARIVYAADRHPEDPRSSAPHVDAGNIDAEDVRGALGAAIERTLEDGEPSSDARGKAVAIAEPLSGVAEATRHDAALAVARVGAPFDDAEREMLRYLCGQAAVSVENIDLHERVSEQAVQDELTGLANSRRFRGLLEKEAVRAERFDHPLSLILVDIDDFKRVNDTYGHLQGDEVLRRVGRILSEESRDVDEPARYGGEEFVVALPETGPEGALEVAERIRTAIADGRVALIEGEGEIRVTASLGVASVPPESATDTRALIAAADAALYRAKRSGKNRCELASAGSPDVSAQGPPLERRT